MAKSKIYAGLEIGTSTICVVVVEVLGNGSIKILGVGQAPSRGVRKGEIVDFETAQTCLNDALVEAEEKSDVEISNVYLAVSGSHIESLCNKGSIRIPEVDGVQQDYFYVAINRDLIPFPICSQILLPCYVQLFLALKQN